MMRSIFLSTLSTIWLFIAMVLPVYSSNVQSMSGDGSGDGIIPSIPLCPESHQCAGCQSATPGCKCDELCQLFDDCCLDMSCNIQSTSVPGLGELNIEHAQVGCVVPVLEASPSIADISSGFYMIDACPDFAIDLELVTKCHKPNITDLQSTIPVSETIFGISFRNIYCALCNNIAVEDIVLWTLQAHCEEDVLTQVHERLDTGASLADTLRIINDFCPISFGSPGKFVSTIGTRSCYPNLLDSSACLPETPDVILEICNGYTAYVVDDQNMVYRNPDCYICSNTINRDTRLDCEYDDLPNIYDYVPIKPPTPIDPERPGIRPGGPGLPGFRPGDPLGEIPDLNPKPDPVPPDNGLIPISVIVDFSSNSGVTVEIEGTVVTVDTVTCKADQVYDPFADTCRVLSCADGYILIGDRCVFMPTGDENDCNGDFEVKINATDYGCKRGSDYADGGKCFSSIFFQLDLHITNEAYECIGEHILSTFVINSTTSFSDLEKAFDTIFLPLEKEVSVTSSCEVNNFNVRLLCDPGPANCTERFILSNVSIEKTNMSTIILHENSTYLFNSGMLFLQYELQEGIIGKEFEKLISAELCNTNQLSCTFVTLNASLFTTYSDNEVLYVPTGDLFSEDEYKFTSDGQIQVCSFFERNGTRNETQTITFLAYDTPQIVLSFVGCVISMVALLITLITYGVFAPLRTHATKSIMNMSVALFTAQLIFLLGAGSTENFHVCTFIAVLSHYLWLSTFTWSTVLSYDLNKTFSSKLVQVRHDKYSNICPYLLYGWLTPFVVIVPCLTLHLCACSDVPFYYGNAGACWIYNQYANLVVFGGPLVACLIVNCVLFFNILWNIHMTKRRTRTINKGKSRLESIKEELSIYIRIATLMGFTWIFAFSAAFSGVSALWYIYIVINSLQGLYIFFAFTFNVRIGRLWKKKIAGGKSDGRSAEESSTSKTSKLNSAVKNQQIQFDQHELTYQTGTGSTTEDVQRSEESLIQMAQT